MNILIVGSLSDPHVYGIKAYLVEKGVDVGVLDIYRERSFWLEGTQQGACFEVLGRPLESYDAILNRMKWHNDPFVPDESSYAEYFYKAEWIYALRGILAVARLAGVPVINDPWRSYFGGNKLAQIYIAQTCGLLLPATLVSSEAPPIEVWQSQNPLRIGKVFDASYVPPFEDADPRAIFTVPLTDDDMGQYLSSIDDNPPLIFQSNVRKSVEARVIASRTDQLAYQIESQGDELARQDWRIHEAGVPYSLTELPGDVVNGIRSMLHRLDLDFGVFDFAIDDQANWRFFECNPDGQWWLPRRRAGGNPERIIADVILAAASRSNDTSEATSRTASDLLTLSGLKSPDPNSVSATP